VFDLVRPNPVLDFLAQLGMTMLFLLAGMEIDFSRVRGRPINLACLGWVVSLALALAAASGLWALGLKLPVLLVALALTTTAIGTLLPILKDAGELSREFGVFTLAAGALGEFGPLLVLSLLPLEDRSTATQALVIAGFVAVAFVTALLVLRGRTPRIAGLVWKQLHKASQLPVRLALLLAAVLVVVAIEFGLEELIGAFAAGMILGMVARGEEAEEFHHKLDGIGFGFLIPIFFVMTGVRFDLAALLGSTTSLLCVPLFLVLFLVARGLPAVLYWRVLNGRDRLALAFYKSAALPLVVAIVEIGVETHQMPPEIAAALVGAGMLSLLLFPKIAMAMRPPAHPPVAAEAHGAGAAEVLAAARNE
jgi:Kef-type K+ transport system membrane component KefB